MTWRCYSCDSLHDGPCPKAAKRRIQAEAVEAVLAERARQDARWGEQNHSDYYWLGILGEEFGEASKALIEGKRASVLPYQDDSGKTITTIAQSPDTADLEKELTHVAAVAIAWLEAIGRRKASRATLI